MIVPHPDLSRLGIRSTLRAINACTLVLFTLLPLLTASPAGDEDSHKIAHAATLVRTGKLDEAEGLLWDVLKQHPENAQALNLLGSIRLEQKRFAESETLLNRAITLAPDILPAHINLARVFHAQGETEKEIAVLVDAVKLFPTDGEVDSSLAAAYLKQNDYRHALEALQRIPT